MAVQSEPPAVPAPTTSDPLRSPRSFRLRTLLAGLTGLSVLCFVVMQYGGSRRTSYEVCCYCGAVRAQDHLVSTFWDIRGAPRVIETGAPRLLRERYGLHCRKHEWVYAPRAFGKGGVDDEGGGFFAHWEAGAGPLLERLAESRPRDVRALLALLMRFGPGPPERLRKTVWKLAQDQQTMDPQEFFQMIDRDCRESRTTWAEQEAEGRRLAAEADAR